MQARTVTLRTGTVEIWPDCVRTTLPDGRVVMSAQQDDDEYRARAAALGYDSPAAMNAAHDLLHCLVADWLGVPVSPVLDAVASGVPLSPEDAEIEEAACLALARLANDLGVDIVALAQRGR